MRLTVVTGIHNCVWYLNHMKLLWGIHSHSHVAVYVSIYVNSVKNHKSPHLWFSVLFCSHTWLMCMCVPLNICLCAWYLRNSHVCKTAGIWQWPSFECCSDICVFGDAVKPILMFRIKGKTGTHAVCCQKAVLVTETCQQADEREKAEKPPTLFNFYGHITNRLIYRTKGYKCFCTLYVKTRYMV